MTRFKKMILIVFCLLVLGSAGGVWGYMVYMVNQNFPAAENIAITEGEEGRYKGLRLTAGEMEIYDYEEAVSKYPALISSYDSMETEGTAVLEDMKNYYYVFVHMNIRNTMNQTLDFGKESILYWPIEVGSVISNCMDMFQFTQLNPMYSRSFDENEELDMVLPYAIYKEYISLEDLKQSEIKIVYSYYPTKNYMLYQEAEK